MFQNIWKKRIEDQKKQIKVSERLIEDQHQTINKIDMEDDEDMIGRETSGENIESKAISEKKENYATEKEESKEPVVSQLSKT